MNIIKALGKIFSRKNFSFNPKAYLGIDWRSLAVVRVGLGVSLLLDLLIRAQGLVAHYTDKGLFLRQDLIDVSSQYRFSIFLISGNEYIIAGLFVIAAILAGCLILGYRTRLVTILLWIFWVSLMNRNFLILQGGDSLLRALLFWAMFLPLGRAFSLDRALLGLPSIPKNGNSNAEIILSENKAKDKPKSKPKKAFSTYYFSMGTFAWLLQMVLLYSLSVFHKNGSEWWPDGIATFMTLQLDQFTTPIGEWLVNFPELLRYMTYGVFWYEALGFILFLIPWKQQYFRMIGVLGYVALQFGLFMNMHLGLFPVISTVGILAFIPGLFWDKLAKFSKTRFWKRKLIVYYDGNCGICTIVVSVIKNLAGVINVIYQPVFASDNSINSQRLFSRNSWTVELVSTKDNSYKYSQKYFYEFEAFIQLAQNSWLLWWLVPIFNNKYISNFGDGIYFWLVDKYHSICELPSKSKKDKKINEYDSTYLFFQGEILVSLALLIVIFFNILGLPQVDKPFPSEFKWVVQTFRLDQTWNMFSPYPLTRDGWHVVIGQTATGEKVQLFPNPEKYPLPIGDSQDMYQKPENISGTYPTQRWRKYFLNLVREKNEKYRNNYVDYLCRNNNIEKVTWDFYAEYSVRDPEKESSISKIDLGTFRCR